MAFALISIILLIILVLIAVKTGLNKAEIGEDGAHAKPIIHASGIYSIVRKSPRDAICGTKPRRQDIVQYLSALNEDIDGLPLPETEKSRIIDWWNRSIEEHIAAIEQGDLEGIEFYYYDFVPARCPVCSRYFSQGKFVTREEIYGFPAIIPPLHLGCTCKLLPHHGKENLRETTEMGMLPLFRNRKPPNLPDWKETSKIDVA